MIAAAVLVFGAQAGRAQSKVRADFNGDGFSDLAIGVPREDVGSIADAGAVNVLYGSASGFSAAGNQFWHQDSDRVNNKAESFDLFASSLAGGDFNGDGFIDLAVGVPMEETLYSVRCGYFNNGAVNVLYGSARGLSAAGDRFWCERDLNHIAIYSEVFGYALGIGDFNGDSFLDLAVAAPGEHFDGVENAGSVFVLYGSARGLSAAGSEFWHQGKGSGIADSPETGDNFGFALTP
jgi:hypothetical protein